MSTTPEPWTIKPSAAPQCHNGDIGIINNDGTLIAVAISRPANKTTIANAVLISAAPEMLATLHKVFERITDNDAHVVLGHAFSEMVWNAIKTAEGEPKS